MVVSTLNEIINNLFNSFSFVLEHYSKSKRNELLKLLRNTFLIGSSILGSNKTWDNDNDIDLFFYIAGEKRIKKFNRLCKLIPYTVEETFNLDIIQYISTDEFNNNKQTLTDYLFNTNKKEFSFKKGIINVITPEAYFITKIASLHNRYEKRDYLALKVLYNQFGNKLPNIVEQVINEFNLTKSLNDFYKWLSNH